MAAANDAAAPMIAPTSAESAPTIAGLGYSDLTVSCNTCHQGIDRSFIVIQTPTTSPFTDQSFSPPKR